MSGNENKPRERTAGERPQRDAPQPASAVGEAQPPPAAQPAQATAPHGRRVSVLEGAVTEIFRRGIEAGWDRVSRGEHKTALRAMFGEMRIPREVAAYIGSQLDDTKAAILKVVAREIRQFLQTSHFADELARLLTTLSFEIKTDVRFVPNEDGKKLRPKVTSRARLRRRRDDYAEK